MEQTVFHQQMFRFSKNKRQLKWLSFLNFWNSSCLKIIYSSFLINFADVFKEELQLFRKIAPLTFDEFSGETVLDHYLVSHANFLDLFTKYGVKGNEVSHLIEYGLISSGGRHEIIVEKGELSGFQNDNLVLTFTTESDERITFEYSAFHLTDTAKTLIDILEIEANDEFFKELGEEFRRKLCENEILLDITYIDSIQ